MGSAGGACPSDALSAAVAESDSAFFDDQVHEDEVFPALGTGVAGLVGFNRVFLGKIKSLMEIHAMSAHVDFMPVNASRHPAGFAPRGCFGPDSRAFYEA